MPGTMMMGPVGLLVVYGLARGGAVGCNELRNSIFAKVAQVGDISFCKINSISLRTQLLIPG